MEIIELDSNEYPPLLKQIKNPPKTLYARGEVSVLQGPCFAIVGTRKASREGFELARRIAEDLARTGLCIVSGLAQGIDGASHKGALAGGGKTIGVLASSLEERLFFPYEHLQLAREMIQKGGAVVSEHAENTPALKHHFIARNRIVSGLSLGVLVVEAPLKSGALITAQFGRKQSKPIFAIPGSPFSKNAKGTNLLLKTGAYLVESANDILTTLERQKLFRIKDTLNGNSPEKDSYANLCQKEQEIIQAINEGERDIDKIVQSVSIPISVLLPLLTQLELKGLVKHIGSGKYCIISDNFKQ